MTFPSVISTWQAREKNPGFISACELASLRGAAIVSPQSVNKELEPIGERLLKTREKADLSVSDVAHRTRIPNNVIVALEAGDFSIFDSPTYAKSFLAQYGEFLEVDTRPWLDAIEPASYIPLNDLLKFVDPAETKTPPPPRPVEVPNPMWSALWILLLSGGILGGSIYGYFEMEKRFSSTRETTPAVSKANQTPEKVDLEETPEENELHAPPRAIIVRE